MKTIYLHFSPGKNWYSYLLKKGFSHVSVFIDEDDQEKNLFLCSDKRGTYIDFLDAIDFNHVRQGVVLKVHLSREVLMEEGSFKFYWLSFRWGLYACCSLAKSILGIKSFSQTPYQLYKYLTSKKYKATNPHILNVEIISIKKRKGEGDGHR